MTLTPDAIAAHAKAQRVTREIAEAQLRYAARPYYVQWRDSHCSVPARFDTLDEAFAHIQHNWTRIKARVARERYNASNLRRSFLEGPGFKWNLRDVLLAHDVSSYRGGPGHGKSHRDHLGALRGFGRSPRH